MAKCIGVIGESGSGKTTSCRNLDPATTYYIDCDRKGLSWKGWRSQYNAENKNYISTNFPTTVLQLLQKINEDPKKRIKTVVIDTINGIMVAEEMRNSKVQGYGKWTDLAQYVWDIFEYALTMRDDITVVILCHAITDTDDNGIVFTHIRTNGRKLEKIVLESKLTTVLLAECKDDKFIFHTRKEHTTAKAPIGAFDTDEIPNDIAAVIKALEDY